MPETEDDSTIGGPAVVEELRRKSPMQLYFKAMRPWSFSASVMPAALGTVLSYKDTGIFNILTFVLTLIVVVSLHAAGNLVNTYYDYVHGIDNEISDDATLAKHVLSPQQVVRLSLVGYVTGFLCFLLILGLSPARLEILALLFFCGLSGSYLYTGSIGLKYYALGDCLILMIFGPACVLSSYTVQCGRMRLYSVLYVIPIVLNTEAILHGNNSRDRKADSDAGILTLAILLGRQLSYVLYFVLIFTPYLMMMSLMMSTSWSFVLPLVTIPLALKLDRDFKMNNLTTIAQDTAKLNLLLGFLYILACCLM